MNIQNLLEAHIERVDNMIKNNLKAIGRIYIEVRNPDGSIAYKQKVKNIITNTGKALFAGLAGNVGALATLGWIATGTSNTAAAASQTALGAEIATVGLSRAATTNTRTTTSVTNDTLSMSVTFTVSGAGATVQEIGIFNASSSGIMAGRQVVGPYTLVSGQQLLVTYTIQFS